MIDEGAEGARPDVRAADEAEPVEALLVGQMDALFHVVRKAPMLG
jgi:hypothetical protein